jgi:hypothetical protein
MAKLNPNTLIGILRGKLGDLVFVPGKDGTVIVKHRPVRRAEFTPAQRANHSRFAQAVAYARLARQQPDLDAFYRALARDRGARPCDLAHADFCHPPIIEDVDLGAWRGQAGDRLQIRASDDVGVSSVSVRIGRLDGALIEEGPAQPESSSGAWTYAVQTGLSPGQPVLVEVRVNDRPGNTVAKPVHYVLS